MSSVTFPLSTTTYIPYHSTIKQTAIFDFKYLFLSSTTPFMNIKKIRVYFRNMSRITFLLSTTTYIPYHISTYISCRSKSKFPMQKISKNFDQLLYNNTFVCHAQSKVVNVIKNKRQPQSFVN